MTTASVLLSGHACAEKWTIDAGIDSRVEMSSNTDISSSTGGHDTVVDFKPRVSLRGDGGRLKLAGTVALSGTAFLDHTQSARLVPSADVSARVEAVEKIFFIDTGYRATQTAADPFGQRSNDSVNSNTITTGEFRLTPSIELNFGPDRRADIRSENAWVSSFGAAEQTAVSSANGHFGRHSASFEQSARPLGWLVSVERSFTKYSSDTQEQVPFDVARANVNYRVAEELTVGVRALREHNKLQTADERRIDFGVEANWRPTQRTNLSAFHERHFFGNAWSVAFSHRQPLFAWDISLSKGLSSAPQALFELPATQNVAGLIDAMLTTRFPDPAERARAVQEFMLSRGLPGTTLQPLTLFSERLSLSSARRASFSIIGIRSALAFSAFQSQTQDLPGVTLSDTGSQRSNTKQYGVGSTFTHKLSPDANLKTGADWSRVRGLGANAAQQSTERSVNLQFDLRLSMKSTAYIGGLHRSLQSTAVSPGQESRIYLGMDHRF